MCGTWTRGTRNDVFNEETQAEDFNTYGVRVDPEWIAFYFNRCEVWRTKTPPEHRQPKFVLLNLALGSGYPIDETPNPTHTYVDYVRVYAFNPD